MQTTTEAEKTSKRARKSRNVVAVFLPSFLLCHQINSSSLIDYDIAGRYSRAPEHGITKQKKPKRKSRCNNRFVTHTKWKVRALSIPFIFINRLALRANAAIFAIVCVLIIPNAYVSLSKQRHLFETYYYYSPSNIYRDIFQSVASLCNDTHPESRSRESQKTGRKKQKKSRYGRTHEPTQKCLASFGKKSVNRSEIHHCSCREKEKLFLIVTN